MPRLLITLPKAASIGGVESWFGDLAECLPPLGWEVIGLAVAPTCSEDWVPPRYWSHVISVGKPWWAVRDYALAVRRTVVRERPDLVLSFAYDAPLMSGPNIPPGPRVIDGVYTGLPAEIDRVRCWHHHFDGLLAIGVGTLEAIEGGLESVPMSDRPLTRLIRHGFKFPPASPPPITDADQLRLIWFGRVNGAIKRVFDLIPLCRALQQSGTPFTLTVLGDGADVDELRRAAQEFPPGLIGFIPATSAEKVYDVLAGHHIYLSMSEAEGGPRTLLEAMSCSIVPIVSDIPGYSREVVEDGENGFRVPVGEIGAFADRIRQLANDRKLLSSMSKKCRPAVETGFALTRMARELDAFFRETLAAPTRRNTVHSDADRTKFLADRWAMIPQPLMLAARWAGWKLRVLPSVDILSRAR